jgi:hypothetical protein
MAERKAGGPPKAVQDCHDLLQWLIPHLDKFPRNRRFTLGERLESELIALLADLVDASYAANPAGHLAQANRHLNIARHLWRLCHELQVIPAQRYEHGAKLMLEIGRQVGGWRKLSR